MSFNTNWDVEQYRSEHECEEHWELRRNFMLAHKDSYPEDRLVCLAQVFFNVELLGCRYPAETMELMAELSQGVADEYREKQKTKLQRTFVKASDAAGAKVKGLKRPAGDMVGPPDIPKKSPKRSDQATPQHTFISFLPAKSDDPQNFSTFSQDTKKSSLAPKIFDSNSCSPATHQDTKTSSLSSLISQSNSRFSHMVEKDKSLVKSSDQETKPLRSVAVVKETLPNGCEVIPIDLKSIENKDTCTQNVSGDMTEPQITVTKLTKKNRKILKGSNKDKVLEEIEAGKFGKLILLEDDVTTYPGQIIARSAACCQIPFRFEYEDSINQPKVFCKIFLNNQLLSSACGTNKKDARKVAVELGYEKLRELCYVLKVKKTFLSEGDIIDRGLADSVPVLASGGCFFTVRDPTQSASLDTPMAENIGSKLMRSMGWTGGGLGKDEQGLQEPVRLSQQVNRSGLGLTKGSYNMGHFKTQFQVMLRNYMKKDSLYDLVFASDFSIEERAAMHQMASARGLKSKSYGKNNNRHLVISKKKDFVDIVASMIQSGEYSTDRFELLEPEKPLSTDSSASFIPFNPVGSVPSCSSQAVGASTSRNVFINEELSVEVNNLLNDMKVPESALINPFYRNVEVFKLEDDNNPAARERYQGLCAGPYGKLVLVEEEGCTTPTQIVERSANGCHVPFRYEYETVRGGMLCKLYVNNTLVVTATDFSKKKAREIAVDAGVQRLRDLCYTLKTQVKVDGDKVSIIKRLKPPCNRGIHSVSSSTDIICVSTLLDSLYLGYKSYNGIQPTQFKIRIQDLLRDYARDTCPYDLVIPPDFAPADRWSMQKSASRHGLKTSVYEVSKRDFLVIGKKQPITEIAEAMLRTGGNTKSDPMQVS